MVDSISADELNERLQRGDPVQIIDIRPEQEYASGHIPGAENIPFDRFAREVDNHTWEETIVVVCPLGESSVQAARLLESYEGVSDDAIVANLEDGYQGWSYPLEQD